MNYYKGPNIDNCCLQRAVLWVQVTANSPKLYSVVAVTKNYKVELSHINYCSIKLLKNLDKMLCESLLLKTRRSLHVPSTVLFPFLTNI